jgi:lipopolysaccharide biosynthesis glycosyltransferase
MDVAFAFDDNYVEPARVAVEMLLDTHDARCPVTVWLLTSRSVYRAYGRELREQARGRGVIHVLQTDDGFRDLPGSSIASLAHLSPGMYLRLLLPSLVPETVRRLLYLDADTMCVDSLRPLWDIDLAGKPFGATGDPFTPTCAGIPGADDRIDPNAPYFNSGALLIDTARWRELAITEKSFRYIAANRGRMRYGDQDALNVVAHGNWLRIGREWNHMRSWWFEPKYEQHRAWALREPPPRMLHIAGPRKPWHVDFPTGFRRDWYEATARRLGLAVPSYEVLARCQPTDDTTHRWRWREG